MSLLLTYWARLYSKQTAHELMLEEEICRLGERYRTQHPFFGLKHFADFALMDRKLCIEVDGASHLEPKQKEKDLKHTMGLKSLGWEVVRITNAEVEANPELALVLALKREAASRQTTVEGLQADLDRLRKAHPELLLPVAKRPTRAKSRPVAAPRAKRQSRKS